MVIYYHTRFGAGWLFDIFNYGIVNRYVLAFPRMGIICGKAGGLLNGCLIRLAALTGQNNMASMNFLGMKPDITLVRRL